jgi:sRNA-binding protein
MCHIDVPKQIKLVSPREFSLTPQFRNITKEKQLRELTMHTKILTFLIVSFTSAVFAEDFKTINGKEYKDATVTRIEPDGIVVKTTSGVTKVYFAELPKQVQERFHYDAAKAASYSAEQAANYAAYQKQEDEARRQRDEAEAKNSARLTAQQTAANRTQALQTRYGELQQQEDQLLLQIGEAKNPVPSTGRVNLCAINQTHRNLNFRFSRVT